MVHLRSAATNSLCQRVGIPTPPAVFHQSRKELLDLPQRTRFPIVAKASEPLAAPAGFKSVLMILCRESLISDYERFAREAPGQH